jgi:hypothetical protein
MNYRVTLAALVLGFGLAGSASAGGFDGTTNLLCTAIDVVGCASGSGCLEGQARAFELPQFMFVDFANKVIKPTGESGHRETSPIRNFDKTEKQIILQGVENQRGWTASIDRRNGDLTVTLAGSDVSFIVFGACTAL